VPPESKGDKPSRSQKSAIASRNWENPAAILLLIRDGHATDMQSLYHALDVPKRTDYLMFVAEIVRSLIEYGLLETEGEKDFMYSRKIKVTPLLGQIQAALKLSLTFLASFNRDRSMIVEPLFGIPDAIVEKLDVFVLMPFKADMVPVYEDHIKPTCASLGLTVRRGDDFFTANRVVEDIWKAMVSARLIVADCTDRNPNVFYEIGLAHTTGKPTILLTQREEDVPFDLRHLRYIPYQLTPRGMKEFETIFKQTVQTVLSPRNRSDH
jgi:hypothetical protein